MKVICKINVKSNHSEVLFRKYHEYSACLDGGRWFIIAENGSEVLLHEADFLKHFYSPSGVEYFVKDTVTCIKDTPCNKVGDVMVFYVGKGGFCHKEPCAGGGWKQIRWANKCIADDKDSSVIQRESEYWHHEYEIVTA